MGRAGVWYTDDLTVNHALIEAPKNFRRCHRLSLNHVVMPNAAETLWHCDGVTMDDVMAKRDYFAMNSQNMKISNFELVGNYSFDGVKNVEVHHAKMLQLKDGYQLPNLQVFLQLQQGE